MFSPPPQIINGRPLIMFYDYISENTVIEALNNSIKRGCSNLSTSSDTSDEAADKGSKDAKQREKK